MTGNIELVAGYILEGMTQAAGHCDIFPIKEAHSKTLHNYNLIGFGFPVPAFPSFEIAVSD